MTNTLKWFEEHGKLKKLKATVAISDALWELANGEEIKEENKKRAIEELVTMELSKNPSLLNAVINDVTNELYKNIQKKEVKE